MSFESMLHVLHGNKVIFIVIVIVIQNMNYDFEIDAMCGAYVRFWPNNIW